MLQVTLSIVNNWDFVDGKGQVSVAVASVLLLIRSLAHYRKPSSMHLHLC